MGSRGHVRQTEPSCPEAATSAGPARRHRKPLVLVAHPVADLYGSDRMLLESIRGLYEAGARVVLTIPAPGPLVARARACGAEIRYCPTPVLRRALLSPRAAVQACRQLPGQVTAMLRLLRELRPQAVYISTLTVPLWTVFARLAGSRVVAHVHEAEESAPLPLRAALALPLAAAHEVLVNSRFSREVLHRSLPALPGATASAQVVLNAVPGPPIVAAPRSMLDGALRLLYVGRLSHRKGVDVAVRAVALLRKGGVETELDVVGAVFGGDESYERGLRRLIRTLGVGDAVRLHGFQPEIWPFLAVADVCLVPSRREESFGNVAVESVLAARPAVASDTSGLREAAGVYSSVRLVPPGDAAAVADAVGHIAADWVHCRKLAVENAARAARRHLPARYRRRIAAVLLGPEPAVPGSAATAVTADAAPPTTMPLGPAGAAAPAPAGPGLPTPALRAPSIPTADLS